MQRYPMNKTLSSQQKLPEEFNRPKVMYYSDEEIAEGRELYHQLVASFALEGQEPDDFGKVVSLERIRGELTPEQEELILCGKIPSETKRINEKIQHLKDAGLSWKDL